MDILNIGQELDISLEKSWKYVDDSIRYQKKVKKKVFKFLVGLNFNLDVQSRMLS